jgi:hypothetical protein
MTILLEGYLAATDHEVAGIKVDFLGPSKREAPLGENWWKPIINGLSYKFDDNKSDNKIAKIERFTKIFYYEFQSESVRQGKVNNNTLPTDLEKFAKKIFSLNDDTSKDANSYIEDDFRQTARSAFNELRKLLTGKTGVK